MGVSARVRALLEKAPGAIKAAGKKIKELPDEALKAAATRSIRKEKVPGRRYLREGVSAPEGAEIKKAKPRKGSTEEREYYDVLKNRKATGPELEKRKAEIKGKVKTVSKAAAAGAAVGVVASKRSKKKKRGRRK